MIVATAAVGALLAMAVIGQLAGIRAVLLAALLVTTCLLPLALTDAPIVQHVGIAGPVPELRTFGLVIGAGLVLAVLGRSPREAWLLVPFCLWVMAGFAWIWPHSGLVEAGVLQLLMGGAAWAVGAYVAKDARRPELLTLAALLVCGIVWVQVLVTLLQFVGVPINRLDIVESDILGDRVNGTANHPNNLGKLLILLLLLLLPLTEVAKDPRLRRLALVTALAGLIPLVLAQGRANLAAYFAALVFWALLTPAGRQVGAKLAILGGGVAATALSAGVVLARFDEDPSGGVRPQILRIALRALPDHLVAGVGPNYYVDAVSSREGSFIPVHNTFVLLSSEAGLLGFFLLAAPMVWLGLRSVTLARKQSHARALASVAPGLALVSWTGWGMLGTSVFPLALFALAFSFCAMNEEAPSRQLARRTRPPLQGVPTQPGRSGA